MMKAIEIVNPGPESSLLVRDVVDPTLSAGEVLVRVVAAGVNRADLLQRAGKYPPPPGASELLGLEVSGVVERTAPDVTSLQVGDEVCALLSGGGYAEMVAVPAVQVFRRPRSVSLRDAAAIPEAFITAYANLVGEGRLAAGELVLIHGGASGVGTAAIQVARALGARVACTVGDDAKIDRCRALGAELVINYKRQDFAAEIAGWSPSGVSLILDIIGREYFERNLSALAPRGRLVCIATMSGAKAELDIAALMRKRLSVIGSVLRGRSIAEKGELVRAFSERFLPLFESGVVTPIVDSVFPFDKAEDAHTLMRQSGHVGKILLTW
jgi:putative PIG3 family NAD(P)H quinone oxidoreductase